MKLPRNDLDQNYTVVYFFLNKMYKINNHMKSAQVFSQTFLFFPATKDLLFISLWRFGLVACSCLWLQNNLWVPFQVSHERPFYSFTGTNSPMWFMLICMNDTDFIISLAFSLFYFLHATSADVSRTVYIFWGNAWGINSELEHNSSLQLYLQYLHMLFCASLLFSSDSKV